MRLAYADPPYLGCCARYGHDHRDPYGCWDDVATHAALVDRLARFDGWALSLTSGSLREILPLCPDDVRVKTWCSFKTSNPAYCWEPVIFRTPFGWADRGGRSVVTVRDWHAEPVTLRQPVIGAKPPGFCRWVCHLLGVRDGDELVDLFPGTGIMGRVAAQGVLL